MLAELFERLDVGLDLDLAAADRARDHHAEQAVLDQRVDHARGQLALALDLVARAVEQGPERARPLDRSDVGALLLHLALQESRLSQSTPARAACQITDRRINTVCRPRSEPGA